jgi:N-acetylneuraminic acid mutarotase
MNRMAAALLVGSLLSAMGEGAEARVGEWVSGRRMPSARVALVAAVWDGTIYVTGGVGPARNARLKTVDAYDIEEDYWTAREDMLLVWMPSAATALRTEILFAGGGGILARVAAYDPATDTWTERARLPAPPPERQQLALAMVRNRVLAVGGKPGLHGAVASSAVHSYDPALDEWALRTDMPTARLGLVGGTVAGKVYAIGGWNGAISGAVEEYDPVVDQWVQKKDMLTPRAYASSVVVNRRIYVIGGTEAVGGPGVVVDAYDPARDTWRRLADLPNPRDAAAAVTYEGKIYLLGGQSGAGLAPVLDSVLVYDTGFRGPFSVSPRDSLITTWSALKSE